MKFKEQWIWLPKEKYPEGQHCKYSAFLSGGGYLVSEFKKKYVFDKKVSSAKIRFSADTAVRIYVNGKMIASGPAYSGGDFLKNETPREDFYALETEIFPNTAELDFFARVRLMPIRINEYSKGRGGFMLTAHITFDDGTKTVISTNSDWLARQNKSYITPKLFDNRKKSEPFSNAEEIGDSWHAETAPISIREEFEVFPTGGENIFIKPGEEKKIVAEYDRIYGGSLLVRAKTKGILRADVVCAEISDDGEKKSFIFEKDDEYIGMATYSAGKFIINVKNESAEMAVLSVGFMAAHYPAKEVGKIVTSDEKLNKVLKVCAHSLKYCRQLMHLDSPRHAEPLACTGDYYIETLMTALTLGDLSLAVFDIERTAKTLRNNNGRLFHTTYSLIWVFMLRDVYMFTGNKKMLSNCEDALILLLERFDTYIGENGLIETPPDYMFVDWIYVDEFSMHHPPKALGQSSLNMFYYGALLAATEIFEELGENEMAGMCRMKCEKLKNAVNTYLYDEARGLYFEGLNTKTPDELIGEYMPQNTEKRYYLKHSNILGACFGVCDKERAVKILEKVMTDECEGSYQPYFAHFLLEAIFNNGLCEKYTMQVLEQWKKPIEECDKGLPEGFIPPDASYTFDRSHAWGGTPLYSFAKAALGLEVLKPGMKEVRLSPNTLGLESVSIEIPTPYGLITYVGENGKEPIITSPKEINVLINQ